LLDGTVLVIETDGLLARAIQHETDHLNGVLFIDRVSPATKISLRRKLKRLMEEG
jgi:peptide deformylase